MGKIFETIGADLETWIRAQRVFFIATAPRADDGHVNCSPKGGDCLRVLGPRQIAYQDLTGSGAETIAHLRENGRIVVMLCAFAGPPRIVRLHGRGAVILPAQSEFSQLAGAFPENLGTRAIIRVDIDRIADSCGYAVPLMEFQQDRTILDDITAKLGPEKLAAYRGEKNAHSIDGLPALDV